MTQTQIDRRQIRFERSKAGRRMRLLDQLGQLGFTRGEANSLVRIEMTLHSWGEHECNGNIQREGDDCDGKPRWFSDYANENNGKGYLIADRERGALKRLDKIIRDVNTRAVGDMRKPMLSYYHQTDPRGAALYIIRPGDVREGEDVGSVYNRGICVCGR
jgi:hypothetical protein